MTSNAIIKVSTYNVSTPRIADVSQIKLKQYSNHGSNLSPLVNRCRQNSHLHNFKHNEILITVERSFLI